MQGELGIKVKRIDIQGGDDLRILDEDNKSLFIVGDNNWLELIGNAIKNYLNTYKDKLVEIRHDDYEFYYNDSRTGQYARAVILYAREDGFMSVKTLHDGKKDFVYGSWLWDLETEKRLDMTPFEMGLPF